MVRLASLLYSIIATSLAGSAVVVALVAGLGTLGPILIAAGIGALAAIPVSYLVARKLYGLGASA